MSIKKDQFPHTHVWRPKKKHKDDKWSFFTTTNHKNVNIVREVFVTKKNIYGI